MPCCCLPPFCAWGMLRLALRKPPPSATSRGSAGLSSCRLQTAGFPSGACALGRPGCGVFRSGGHYRPFERRRLPAGASTKAPRRPVRRLVPGGMMTVARRWKVAVDNLPGCFSLAFVMSPLLIAPMAGDDLFAGHVALAYRMLSMFRRRSSPHPRRRSSSLRPSSGRRTPIFGRSTLAGFAVLIGRSTPDGGFCCWGIHSSTRRPWPDWHRRCP